MSSLLKYLLNCDNEVDSLTKSGKAFQRSTVEGKKDDFIDQFYISDYSVVGGFYDSED